MPVAWLLTWIIHCTSFQLLNFAILSILPADFGQALLSKAQMWSYDSPPLKSFNDSPQHTVLTAACVVLTLLMTFLWSLLLELIAVHTLSSVPRTWTCASLCWEALSLHCTWKLWSQFLESYMLHLLSEALSDPSLSSVWWVLPLPFVFFSCLSAPHFFCSFLHSSVLSHQIPVASAIYVLPTAKTP